MFGQSLLLCFVDFHGRTSVFHKSTSLFTHKAGWDIFQFTFHFTSLHYFALV